MYKATISFTESTGAGYGLPSHLYISGRGVGMSKSPQKALKIAQDKANQDFNKEAVENGLPPWIGLIPIAETKILTRNDVVVSETYE